MAPAMSCPENSVFSEHMARVSGFSSVSRFTAPISSGLISDRGRDFLTLKTRWMLTAGGSGLRGKNLKKERIVPYPIRH